MPKIMLKSPEEYQRELELYKQLKNNVYTIFKTPEFERQEMVQQLKLESEAKDTARELSRIEEETKEPEISEVVDMENFRDLNNLLEQDLDIFTTDALNQFTKNELIETKDILNVIKRVDKGKGKTKKSIYINDAIDAIDRRLRGSVRVKKTKASKPSKTADDGKSAASAEPMFKEGSKDTQYDFIIDSINNSSKTTKEKKEKLIELLQSKYGDGDGDGGDIEDVNVLTIPQIKSLLQTHNKKDSVLNTIKEKKESKPKKEVKPKNKVDKNQKTITDMVEFKPRQQVMGKGLSKKSKSKSNLGKQDQIYYILSKRAGNNNKLMKKRLKK